MKANELRQKFLDFFKSKGHAIIPSASLIPENDPTVLFTTAGMHPLVPYLMGEPHPEGKRIANVQKCIRTGDIEEVGDNRHLTFFEMAGNWSFGDYFKKEAIEWSFEFLTSKDWMGIDPNKIYVSVYRGDDDVPRDDEAIKLWQEVFRKHGVDVTIADAERPDCEEGHRIYPYGREQNWWGPAGMTGPCGPDTEMYIDTGGAHDPSFGETCHPACDCGRFIEVWNDVFMQYNKTADGKYDPLEQKNVDTGMGIERMLALYNGLDNVFDTDLFAPILEIIGKLADKKYKANDKDDRSMRIIADHLRSAVFMIGDPNGIAPSNVDQGYVLRRLIRRAIRHGRQLGIPSTFTVQVADVVVHHYFDDYPELEDAHEKIKEELKREEAKFGKTIEKGEKEFEKMYKKKEKISGEDAFVLYSTYGYPLELTVEIAEDRGQKIDIETFEKEFKKHQELSRAGAQQKFAGGLADHSEEVIRLHTATHLLHQALRTVLGDHVFQKGSNITKDRLRFDFSHPEKMTPEQKQQVEEIVNEQIKKDLPVHYEILDLEEAKKKGAIGVFEDKYAALGGKIKVYFVGDPSTSSGQVIDGEYFSKEVCGGPHVERTGELGSFKIKKEESSSAGVRRIKAVLK